MNTNAFSTSKSLLVVACMCGLLATEIAPARAGEATCPGANSSLINQLGAAGPANFTVLSLGGPGAVVNINLASVAGNVGVPNNGTLKESAPSSVSGNLIVGSLVDTKGVVGSHGPIVVNDALLAQAVTDATNASTFFAGLPSTPGVQAQFPASGQITTSLTVTGAPGLNVVNLSTFRLNNGSNSLTLTGPAGTAFVINVSGAFDLHTGNIKVAGGVGPLDVVYNVTNPGATVTTMVPTTAIGILLAPNNNINSMDSATFTGEVIGGYGKTIVLMSGSKVNNPCPGTPCLGGPFTCSVSGITFAHTGTTNTYTVSSNLPNANVCSWTIAGNGGTISGSTTGSSVKVAVNGLNGGYGNFTLSVTCTSGSCSTTCTLPVKVVP